MLFNSFNFLIVFPFIFFLYWLIPYNCKKIRKVWLILVSYALYMLWNPFFSLILLYVTIVTYLGGLVLDKKDYTKPKFLCGVLVMTALLPLLIYKYLSFIIDSLSPVIQPLGISFNLPGLNWAIPVGISFYTFQALGYMLDVYYRRIEVERCFMDYLLFCSFFPQTASGPISKPSELLPQIKNLGNFNYEQACDGLIILLWGLFLKIVVADRLGIYVDTVYGNYTHYNGQTLFLASIFYTFQIYGDFAGYSMMAVGIGKCLGFNLINNFNRPYLAVSITEFWKRWHISLTRWLTLYVYIPLGGSRCSKVRQYLNILITFLVSGLWHGANWTFVVWGAMHGCLQIIEKAIGFDPKGRRNNSFSSWKVITIRIAITFLLVNFTWIFFRMSTISGAVDVVIQILTLADGVGQKIQYLPIIILIATMLLGKDLLEEFFPRHFLIFNNRYLIVRMGGVVLLICLILLYGVLDSTQFIYVSF